MASARKVWCTWPLCHYHSSQDETIALLLPSIKRLDGSRQHMLVMAAGTGSPSTATPSPQTTEVHGTVVPVTTVTNSGTCRERISHPLQRKLQPPVEALLFSL